MLAIRIHAPILDSIRLLDIDVNESNHAVHTDVTRIAGAFVFGDLHFSAAFPKAIAMGDSIVRFCDNPHVSVFSGELTLDYWHHVHTE